MDGKIIDGREAHRWTGNLKQVDGTRVCAYLLCKKPAHSEVGKDTRKLIKGDTNAGKRVCLREGCFGE